MNVTLEHLYPTLNRQKRESRQAYMGFLLWAVQDPASRSVRLAAKSLRKSESLLRRWSHRWDWKDRVLGVDQPDIVTLCFLRNLIKASEKEMAEAIRASLTIAMPQSSLFQNLTMEDLEEKLAGGIKLEPKVVNPPQAHLHINLNAAPEPAPASDPAPEAAEESKTEPEPSEAPQIVMSPPTAMDGPSADEVSEDFEQMRKLIQLGRAYILGQLRERKVRVTMADILTLQKAAFLMYGGPTESFAVDFTGFPGMGGAKSEPVSVESYAVKRARESGDTGAYVKALRDDLDEQAALISVIVEAEDVTESETAAK